MALVLIPSAALGTLAVVSGGHYRASAKTAAQIERQVPRIDQLVRLRQALHNEETSLGLVAWGRQLNKSAEQVATLLGFAGITSDATRSATDASVAALGRTSPVTAAEIHTLRRQADALTIKPGVAVERFVKLDAKVADELQVKLPALSKAAMGAHGDSVSAALDELQATFEALQYGAAQATTAGLLLNPATRAPAAYVELGVEGARFDEAAAVLATAPDALIRDAWKRTAGRTDVQLFNKTLREIEHGIPVAGGFTEILAGFKGAAAQDNQLFSMVSEASRLVQTRAAALQSASRATYERWLVAIVLLGLLVAGIALTVARSIARPLRRLADSAQTVAAGQLAIAPIRCGGPRETVLVGEAFNDLAANLRLLDGKTRALAACDFDNPVLDLPLPGRLGEALAGSVQVLSGSIAERDDLQQRLAYDAFHDALTGLANRALFLDRVGHSLRRVERQPTPVGVLFLDLDDFKTVNDSLGHDAGDQLLIGFAQRLRRVARAGDTVARFGGDEFAILIDDGEMPQTAEDMAARISEFLTLPFRLGDNEVWVRASIGIALGEGSLETPADLLRNADMAMYLAKHNGNGESEMFRPELQLEARNRLTVATELRHAIKNDDLEVFYQPIVAAHSGAPIGAEALVRWNHPRRGLVGPADFLSVAEATGLIVPLGAWVLRQACIQTQEWRERGVVDDDFYVSVNLSARQLSEVSLVDSVAEALRESGLPARALVLEITESTLMVHHAAGLDRLAALRTLGVRLALDDYGTGYSSLNRLGTLPVSIVKIDKVFIDEITTNEGAALVKSVIDVSRTLGLSCVAEGVEQAGQRAVLDELGCDSIQGFLCARPTGAGEATSDLQNLRSHQPRSSAMATSSLHRGQTG